MNIKKIIAGTMAVALTAAVSVGGTLAYLMDTDEDVNVMTLGDVYIDQIEQERVDDKENQTELKDFEQNKPLLPAVYPGSSIPWASESDWVVPKDEAWRVVADNTNVIDKFVTVKNTGKSDAYVRTIFAFEEDSSLIHVIINDTATNTEGATWSWEVIPGTFELDGATYSLMVATYTGPLKAGATTIPSLKQIYLDKTATNEDIEKFGDTYDILVFSQAVQSEGFDSIIVGPEGALNEAFGEVSLAANPWVNGDSNFAPASKDLQAAVTAGGDVTLSGDVAITDAAAEAKNIITEDTTVNFSANTVTLDLPDATSATENWVGINVNGGTVVFEGTTGGVTTAANDELYAVVVRNGADLTINGGSYIGGTTAISVTEGTVTINGGYFASQTDNPTYTINCVDAAYKAGTANVIIKGGSFLNWNPANNAAEGAGTSFLAPGYKVVEETVANGTLYTVVAE